MDVGNLISGSSAFSKSSLNIWKFLVHILLKPSLENFEHYFANVWDECNCVVVWTFFGIAFLWDWNENWKYLEGWTLKRIYFLFHLGFWRNSVSSTWRIEASVSCWLSTEGHSAPRSLSPVLVQCMKSSSHLDPPPFPSAASHCLLSCPISDCSQRTVSGSCDKTETTWVMQDSFLILKVCNFNHGFPGGSVVKNSSVNVGYTSSPSGSWRSPGKGNVHLLQYPCLEKSMDIGAWQATVHGVAEESDTTNWLSNNNFNYTCQILIAP